MKSFTKTELRLRTQRVFDAVMFVQDQVKANPYGCPQDAIIDGNYILVRTPEWFEIRDTRANNPRRWKRVRFTGNYSDIGKVISKYFELLEEES